MARACVSVTYALERLRRHAHCWVGTTEIRRMVRLKLVEMPDHDYYGMRWPDTGSVYVWPANPEHSWEEIWDAYVVIRALGGGCTT